MGDFLTREQERDLVAAYRGGDLRARNRLLKAYEPMIKRWAARYHASARQELDDMMQEGRVALLVAFQNFDPEKGALGTLAAFYLKDALRSARRAAGLIRLPNNRATKAILARYTRERLALEREIGCEIGEEHRDELCRRIGISRSDLDQFEQATSETVDIHDQARTDAMSDGTSEDSVIGRIDAARRLAAIENALQRLSPREREIIRLRFLTDEPTHLREIGAAMDLTPERVRQIEARAVEKVRAAILGAAAVAAAPAPAPVPAEIVPLVARIWTQMSLPLVFKEAA